MNDAVHTGNDAVHAARCVLRNDAVHAARCVLGMRQCIARCMCNMNEVCVA